MSSIKDNDEIYAALCQRKKELDLTSVEIHLEAKKYGIKIPKPSLSKYFNRKEGSISEQAILWMCDRYCIKIDTKIEKLEYNEFDAILKLKIKYT